ncbi:MAG: BlaI/MecI/CopY family transcriptional regulator [Lachnospiraceae bacterium]|nr:BlaI/MecI/CopY family transcriptional regulator [Lachnospiraceae bacterium]
MVYKTSGKGYLYYPAVTESDCQLAESRNFLSRVYDGSLSKMVIGFVNLRFTLPLWFSLWSMILFCVPFLSLDVFLISPETQDWLKGFRITGFLWACGCGVFFVRKIVCFILEKQAMKKYGNCNNKRLNRVYSKCAEAITLKKVPVLYCGTLDHPICVTGVIHPAVIRIPFFGVQQRMRPL